MLPLCFKIHAKRVRIVAYIHGNNGVFRRDAAHHLENMGVGHKAVLATCLCPLLLFSAPIMPQPGHVFSLTRVRLLRNPLHDQLQRHADFTPQWQCNFVELTQHHAVKIHLDDGTFTGYARVIAETGSKNQQ